MIRSVVPADRLLGEVHRCEWPDPPRCPWGLRVVDEHLPHGGVTYRVVRCALGKGHDGDCASPDRGYAPPRLATLCGLPMRDDECWVLFDPTPGDRTCEGCADEADRRRPPLSPEERALIDERFALATPHDDRRDR